MYAEKPIQGKPWDVAIIGSGPAALTAAIYTTRGAASTIILGGEKWGGQLMLTTLVDNFPASPGIDGPDLMMKMRDHATKFGGEFIEKYVESVDLSKTPFELASGGVKYQARSVIVATGAETKWLGVPGEEKLRGRGVSSCAPCDAPFFKDKSVAVIGGGDAAMEEALVLTKYARQVTIIYRKDVFRASKAMQSRIFAFKQSGKVKVIWNSEVVEFKGKDNLQTLVVSDVKSKKTSEMPFDGAFVAIGHSPSTKLFSGVIELDKKGYVVKHTKDGFEMSTSVDGVFVAGDVHDYHYQQAITAAAFGCMAGMDAVKYLENIKET